MPLADLALSSCLEIRRRRAGQCDQHHRLHNGLTTAVASVMSILLADVARQVGGSLIVSVAPASAGALFGSLLCFQLPGQRAGLQRSCRQPSTEARCPPHP